MVQFTPSSEDTRIYEVCVLHGHPISQKEQSDLLKQVEALFEEAGATVLEKDVWGRRGLAYTIGGYDDGVYVVYYLDMDPAKLKEMDQAIRIVPGVLRHIIVKPPKGYEVVKFSEEYDEWLKDRETEHERKKQEKEEELKRRMIKKAQVRDKKDADAPAEKKEDAADDKDITAEIDKLIDDDDLQL